MYIITYHLTVKFQRLKRSMMWFKELGELGDVLPYYLLVCLPVFIALSPINPVQAAQELDVHRLAQYEIAGTPFGSKHAALSMEARGPSASHVLRKTIVSRVCDLSVARFRELVSNGAGGMVLILPADLSSLAGDCREALLDIEQELLSQEMEIPIYFAQETEELLELYSSLQESGESGQSGQQSSAMSALVQSIASSGYQLVISAGNPQPLKVGDTGYIRAVLHLPVAGPESGEHVRPPAWIRE